MNNKWSNKNNSQIKSKIKSIDVINIEKFNNNNNNSNKNKLRYKLNKKNKILLNLSLMISENICYK